MNMQPGFLVEHVDTGLIGKVRDDRNVDIGQPHSGVLGKDMSTTLFAPFAIAVGRLVVSADLIRSLSDFDCFGLP